MRSSSGSRASGAPQERVNIEVEGRSSEEVSYQTKLLYEAGLIEALDLSDLGSFCWEPVSLTWSGHEFLDAARSDTLWNAAKSKVVDTTGGLAFEFVREVLKQKGKELLGLAWMGLTKIEAAQRQLDAAIRMFFADDDWVSIHTLVGASGRILRDLSEQRETPIWTMFNRTIKPETCNEFWRNVMNRAVNFLKHADRDAENILAGVNPRVNEHMIFLYCLFFGFLEERITNDMAAFMGWYVRIHQQRLPDLFGSMSRTS